MAKNNTNGNGADVTNGCAITPTIHLILQGKGGVGKTVVAGWLAEFLIHRGQPVHCIDGDPVNRSLAQYKALPVDKLDLVNQDGVVMRSRYDALIDRFLNEEAVFVVDNGATAFLPFWTYVVESNIPAVLREAGRRVYVHVPISGGEMLNDTLLGFKTIAETAAEKSLVVWINEFSGRSHVTAKRSIRCRCISTTVIRSRPRSASLKERQTRSAKTFARCARKS
jgi:CobQ/CobB/MinD/ParA nucleotide binding domain